MDTARMCSVLVPAEQGMEMSELLGASIPLLGEGSWAPALSVPRGSLPSVCPRGQSLTSMPSVTSVGFSSVHLWQGLA